MLAWIIILCTIYTPFYIGNVVPGGAVVKNLPANRGEARDPSLIPGPG